MTNAEWLIRQGIPFGSLRWIYTPCRTHIYYGDQELGALDGTGASALLCWLDEEHEGDGDGRND